LRQGHRSSRTNGTKPAQAAPASRGAVFRKEAARQRTGMDPRASGYFLLSVVVL
jgi:hypothetical protein